MSAAADYVRRVEPLAADGRHAEWPGGAFDAGRRSLTREVEGLIRTPRHVLFVTLSGGARRLEVESECGHRYRGPDFPGAVSLAPADRLRRLQLREVTAGWGSVAFDPDLLDDADPPELAPFTNADDAFAAALVREMARIEARDGGLDPLYGETMTRALGQHLLRRQDPRAPREPVWRIPPRRLRAVEDMVEARLEEPLRIADLAAAAGLSSGYFHRAFRLTVGMTPLEFVTRRRVARADALLATTDLSVARVAVEVGFTSPGRFARVYRRLTGRSPSERRRDARDARIIQDRPGR